MAPIAHELIPAPDPIASCELLAGLPCCLLLDSAVTHPDHGRYSFLTADPVALIRQAGTHVERLDLASGDRFQLGGDVLAAARAELRRVAADPIADLPPFQAGLAGYLGYEFGSAFEGVHPSPDEAPTFPDAQLALYDWVVAWDHTARRCWVISTGVGGSAVNGAPAHERAQRRLREVLSRFSVGTSSMRTTTPPSPIVHRHSRLPQSSFERDSYVAAVQRVRDYILAGDVFQANLSQRFCARSSEPPLALYRRLRDRTPAPFAAYLSFPDVTIASASPERFLRVTAEGDVETRPIKGTRPRGTTPDADARLAQELLASEKDRAENVMIADLLRNDLSRVCAPGSVRATELCALESWATVHHLVSTIVGRLEPPNDAIDLLRAAFPGGSVTGAPKIRAMEIIAELEPVRRGVYCGTVGYVSRTGAMDSSIVIRTFVCADGYVTFGAGGGVVADSEPEAEYDETMLKARALIEALTPSA